MKLHVGALLILMLCAAGAITAAAQNKEITAVREGFVNDYLKPEGHFRLAKYYLDRGEKLQAFLILEYARRYRFEEKDFDDAYFKFFGDPMPEPPERAKDAFETASSLVKEQKYEQAENHFLQANQLYNKSFFINAWIGRFYFKNLNDADRALPFYFAAYFLYPHAYETEYVEYRIRSIAYKRAEEVFQRSAKDSATLQTLAVDPNPIIQGLAIGEIGKNWAPKYRDTLLAAMESDDSANRWRAFVTLMHHSGDDRDELVDRLLAEPDMRKRGLAAYAIIERTDAKRFQILKAMLGHRSELIRFDAVSALVMKGGDAGRRILMEHQRLEKQPRLKALITKALNERKTN